MDEKTYSFEVFSREGKRLMYTNDKGCIYDRETIKNMIKAGFKFKENGKVLKKV